MANRNIQNAMGRVEKLLQDFLRISRAPLDSLAGVALKNTRKHFEIDEEEFLVYVRQKGLWTSIVKVAKEFVSASDMRRRVLAATFNHGVNRLLRPGGPEPVIREGNPAPEKKKEGLDPRDFKGFADSLRGDQDAEDGPVHFFVGALLDAVIKRNKLKELPADQRKRVVAELCENDVPLGAGKVEKRVMEAIKGVLSEGNIPHLVEVFVNKKEIEGVRFTPRVRQAMIDYLLARSISLETVGDQDIIDGKYDEYFALAYEHAVAAGGGRDGGDPLQAVRSGGPSPPWDFSVDTFEDVEEQGIVRDNILAAGAIDYIYELGERMGIFKLADVLILNWSSGAIDVAAGEAADMLYAYWKNAEDRSTPEDRGMLYKRVLDKGDANVLSRMVANEHFGTLWTNLMSEVAEYIRRTEKIDEGRGESSPVSKSRIYQATRELQYNLTEYCTGMAHKQAHELYKQLQDAMAVLSHEDVITHFGGKHRKSLWTVIEQLSKSEFGDSPNIGAIRSLAVDGNKIFQWIADFDKAAVTTEQFEEFLEAAEAYILNMATVGEGPDWEKEEEDFEDDFEDESENEDEDFEDF